MTAAARAALAAALDMAAWHGFKASPNAATFRILKVACMGVKATIATSIYYHLERYATELEAVYQRGDMRGLYQHLKRSTGLGGRQARGQQFVTDENGVLLRNKDAILKRWRRFFDTLLNSNPPTLNPDVVEQVNGDDEPIFRERLRAIFVEVWNGGEMPQEWKDTTIKVLYKKGERSNCNNFRGISPLSHELGRRRRIPLYMCFINLQKAYDSVDRELLWKVPAWAGIPAEMIAVIRKFHAETLVMRVKEKQPPLLPPPPLIIEAAGQRYAQTTEFRYLGGLVTEQGDLTREINHRSKAAWACFKRYKTELFDRPGAPFGLKACLLKAEAAEALLYGCVTWFPRCNHYRLLRTTPPAAPASHRPPAQARHPPAAVIRPGAEEGRLPECGGHHPSMAPVVCGGRSTTTGQAASKRLMFGELAGGEKPGKGSPEKNWLTCLKDDLRVFGAPHGSTDDAPFVFGVPKLVWSEAAKV
eukprot:g10868.t1